MILVVFLLIIVFTVGFIVGGSMEQSRLQKKYIESIESYKKEYDEMHKPIPRTPEVPKLNIKKTTQVSKTPADTKVRITTSKPHTDSADMDMIPILMMNEHDHHCDHDHHESTTTDCHHHHTSHYDGSLYDHGGSLSHDFSSHDCSSSFDHSSSFDCGSSCDSSW